MSQTLAEALKCFHSEFYMGLHRRLSRRRLAVMRGPKGMDLFFEPNEHTLAEYRNV